jgi:hypothetical protein
MFEAKYRRKHTLECLRLQTDCMELAGIANGYDVQSHFVSMARFWGDLAVSGPASIPDPKAVKDEMGTP